MKTINLHSTSIDMLTKEATIIMGVWSSVSDWTSGAKPNSQKTLTMLLPAVGMENQDQIASVIKSYNWKDDGQLHYVADATGKVVPKPVQPAPYFKWDWASCNWADSRTLQDVKDSQWGYIKLDRELNFNAPLVTPYGVFDAKKTDRANIAERVAYANNLVAMGHPVAIKFTLYDNSVIVLNETAMVQVGLLMGARSQLIRDHATELRAAIDAATTMEAVLAITWSSIV